MKVWRLLDDDGAVIATVPFDRILDPDACSANRAGFGVYEAFDSSGHLIYTGRTSNLAQRLRAHSTQSAWWGFASKIHWTPVDNYGEAVGLERIGISTDLGDWNLAGRRALESCARQTLPAAMASRICALYAAADARGKSFDLDNYICTAREFGWTLQALADVLNVTREAVRQRSLKGVVDYDLVIPRARRLGPSEKPAKVWPTIPLATASEMQSLQERARLVRGLTAIDHPNRQASERLTELIVEAKLRGVRDREVAEILGVTVGAVISRVKRHGYRHNAPSQSDYRPGSGLVARGASDSCRRGHPYVGENVRFINGDPTRRTCRTCERMRSAAYVDRKGRPRSVHFIRAWALEQGLPIGPTGPIPTVIRDAYEAAHLQSAA